MNFKLFLALYLINLVAAVGEKFSYQSEGSLALYSCTGYFETVAAFCGPEDMCYCSNINFRASIMGCLASQGRMNDDILKEVVPTCERYMTNVTVEELRESYQYYLENAVNISSIPNFNISKPVDVPILVDDEEVNHWKISNDKFRHIYNDAIYYGAATLAYWPLVMFFAAIFRWLNLLVPKFMNRKPSKLGLWFRKNVTGPATCGKKRTQEKNFGLILDFLSPSRLETAVLLGYAAVTIACFGADISYYPHDKTFGSRTKALSRYIAVRGGILASFNAPLLILFAGRNNFLQWVTGWNFASFITYHRWIGRVVFIEVMVHSIGYSITFSAYYLEYMSENYVVWGMVGTCCGGLIVVQSLLVLRRKYYEIFLIIHILLAIFFMVGAWYHVVLLGYVNWYLSAVVIWGFDRLVRVVRLLVFGFPKSQLQIVGKDIIKVVVPKPSYWNHKPNNHVFVHFILPLCFWQSHCFCISDSPGHEDKIVLYCKVKGGVTHSVYKYLANRPNNMGTIRVGIEGPYGETSAAKTYDTGVFVAGGNGIPGIYSEAISFAGNKRAKLVWIVRDHESIEWYEEELRALANYNVETTIYFTRPRTLDFSSSSDQEKVEEHEKLELNEKSNGSTENSSLSGLDHIISKQGRPKMDDFVKKEIEESNGLIAFVTCGAPAQVDELRYTVYQNLVPDKKVEFFEELQVWS